MIIVTGGFKVQAESFEKALLLSQQHVEHSLGEAGCISHRVYTDPLEPCRLFFFEQWQDKQAIEDHFAHPNSQAFVAAIRKWVVDTPTLQLFAANEIT